MIYKSEDRCIMCGKIIPEGRYCCKICEIEVQDNKHKIEKTIKNQYIGLSNNYCFIDK